MHAGLLHLGLNTLALAQLGPEAEAVLGPQSFLTIYLLSGLSGSVASFLTSPSLVTVGASGAIFGLLGVPPHPPPSRLSHTHMQGCDWGKWLQMSWKALMVAPPSPSPALLSCPWGLHLPQPHHHAGPWRHFWLASCSLAPPPHCG